MHIPDIPTFSTWEHSSLARFATDCYRALQAEKQTNEQLRLKITDMTLELHHLRDLLQDDLK